MRGILGSMRSEVDRAGGRPQPGGTSLEPRSEHQGQPGPGLGQALEIESVLRMSVAIRGG